MTIITQAFMLFFMSALTSLYRYWKGSIVDHFYTTNIHEIGTAAGGITGHHGYVSEGTQCLLYTRQVAGSIPLYRYWKSSVGDHLYTTAAHEIGTTTPGAKGNFDYIGEGITGYCFPQAIPGAIPLYRYWKPGSASDHFYTTSSAEIGTTVPGQEGKHGYFYEGVVCFVIPYYG